MESVWISIKGLGETEVSTVGVRNVDGLKKALKEAVAPALANVSVMWMRLYQSHEVCRNERNLGDEVQGETTNDQTNQFKSPLKNLPNIDDMMYLDYDEPPLPQVAAPSISSQ
eukprot:343406-Amphidinium_carterae.1